MSRRRWLAVLLLVALLATQVGAAKKDDDDNDKDSKSSKRPSPRARPPPPPAASTSSAAVCSTYTVQSGDTASSVATNANVDYEALIVALQQCIGYKPGDFLNVGQAVCLPPYYPSCRYVSTAGGKDGCRIYTVQMGDTMSSIAASFAFDLADLEETNDDIVAPGDPVRPGQLLRLPSWSSSCPDVAGTLTSCQVYAAKPGDTISSIATAFRTTVDDILAVNQGLAASSVLSTAQPIKIPPFPDTCGAGNMVTGPSTDSVTVCRAYVLQEGDSVASVATEFGLSAADVASENPELEDASNVQPGKKIKLPPWDTSCPTEGIVVTSAVPVTSDEDTVEEEEEEDEDEAPTASPSSPSSSPSTPKPVQVSPVKTPVSGPAEAPAPALGSASSPSSVTGITKVEMLVQSATVDEFTEKQSEIVSALASAARVPETNVTVMFVLPATGGFRRLLVEDAVKVLSTVIGNVDAVEANLIRANEIGTLTAAFEAEDMVLDTLILISPTGEMTPVIDPSSTPEIPSDSSKSATNLPIGIIAGAAIGAVGLISLATTVCCVVSKRRRARREHEAEAAAMARLPGANAYITTASGYHKGSFHKDGGNGSPYKNSNNSPRKDYKDRNSPSKPSYVVHAYSGRQIQPRSVDILPAAAGVVAVPVAQSPVPTHDTVLGMESRSYDLTGAGNRESQTIAQLEYEIPAAVIPPLQVQTEILSRMPRVVPTTTASLPQPANSLPTVAAVVPSATFTHTDVQVEQRNNTVMQAPVPMLRTQPTQRRSMTPPPPAAARSASPSRSPTRPSHIRVALAAETIRHITRSPSPTRPLPRVATQTAAGAGRAGSPVRTPRASIETQTRSVTRASPSPASRNESPVRQAINQVAATTTAPPAVVTRPPSIRVGLTAEDMRPVTRSPSPSRPLPRVATQQPRGAQTPPAQTDDRSPSLRPLPRVAQLASARAAAASPSPSQRRVGATSNPNSPSKRAATVAAGVVPTTAQQPSLPAVRAPAAPSTTTTGNGLRPSPTKRRTAHSMLAASLEN